MPVYFSEDASDMLDGAKVGLPPVENGLEATEQPVSPTALSNGGCSRAVAQGSLKDSGANGLACESAAPGAGEELTADADQRETFVGEAASLSRVEVGISEERGVAIVVRQDELTAGRKHLLVKLTSEQENEIRVILQFNELIRWKRVNISCAILGFFSALYYIELIQGGLQNFSGLAAFGYVVNSVQSSKIYRNCFDLVLSDTQQSSLREAREKSLWRMYYVLCFLSALVSVTPTLAGPDKGRVMDTIYFKGAEFVTNLPINYYGIRKFVDWICTILIEKMCRKEKKITCKDTLRRARQKIIRSPSVYSDFLCLQGKFCSRESSFEEFYSQVIDLTSTLKLSEARWASSKVKPVYLFFCGAVGVFIQNGWGFWSFEGMIKYYNMTLLPSSLIGLFTFLSVAGIGMEAGAECWSERNNKSMAWVLRPNHYMAVVAILFAIAPLSGFGLKYAIDNTLGDPSSHFRQFIDAHVSLALILLLCAYEPIPSIFSDWFQNLPFAKDVIGEIFELRIGMKGSDQEKNMIRAIKNLKVVEEKLGNIEQQQDRIARKAHQKSTPALNGDTTKLFRWSSAATHSLVCPLLPARP